MNPIRDIDIYNHFLFNKYLRCSFCFDWIYYIRAGIATCNNCCNTGIAPIPLSEIL